MIVRVFLISLHVSLCVGDSFAAGCPDVKGVEHFNLTGVSEGFWYEIGRYEYDIEVATSCVVVRTSPLSGGFVGESTNVPPSSSLYLRGECNVAEDSGRGVLNFTLSSGGVPKRIRQLPEVNVIYNEGINIINYSCLADETKNTKEEFAWIFSRKQELSDEEKEDLMSTVRSIDVLDINKFIWIDQSQCSEN